MLENNLFFLNLVGLSVEIYLSCILFFLLYFIGKNIKEMNVLDLIRSVYLYLIKSIFLVMFFFFLQYIFGFFSYNDSLNILLLNGNFKLNIFIFFMKFFVLFVTLIILLLMYNNNKLGLLYFNCIELPLLILISILGMFIVFSANDLIFLFVGLELQTLPIFILICLKRYSNISLEAGLKYFIYTSFFSGIIFYGISILYGILGTTNFDEIREIFLIISQITLNNLDNISSNFLDKIILYGLFFLLVGLFFKLGIVPFHLWLSDVYEGSPYHITYYFAVVPKISIIYVVYLLFFNLFFEFYVEISPIFLYCGFLSICVGSIFGLYQTKIKRLLAFSTIVQMGYILTCFSLGIEGISWVFVFLFVYVLMLMYIFTLILSLNKSDNTPILDIVDFTTIINVSNKFYAILLVSGLLCLTGVPPFLLFFLKVYGYYLLMSQGYEFIIFFIMLIGLISVIYYIRIIRMLLFNDVKYRDKILILFKGNSFILILLFIIIISCIFLQIPFLYFYFEFVITNLWILP